MKTLNFNQIILSLLDARSQRLKIMRHRQIIKSALHASARHSIIGQRVIWNYHPLCTFTKRWERVDRRKQKHWWNWNMIYFYSHCCMLLSSKWWWCIVDVTSWSPVVNRLSNASRCAIETRTEMGSDCRKIKLS